MKDSAILKSAKSDIKFQEAIIPEQRGQGSNDFTVWGFS